MPEWTSKSRSHYNGALVPAESSFQVCCLCRWLGGALVLSEAGHQVCWFWSLLGLAVVQSKVIHFLCLALGCLVELQGDLQLIATCAGLAGIGRGCPAN